MNIHDHEGIQTFLDEIGLSSATDKELDQPRYNVAPGARVRGLMRSDSGDCQADAMDSTLVCAAMTWGVIPPWARAASYNKPLINARAETAFQKRSFKKLISEQRAVIPINGFYEWHRDDGPSEAFHFTHPDRPWLAVAAIWQASPDGDPQCCLLTTAANSVMKPIHHRMPVLLNAEQVGPWLTDNDPATIKQLMKSPSDDAIVATRVSSHVNNARNEGEECVAPA